MTDDPEGYLRRAGIAYRKGNGKNGRELLISCPSCARDGKCSVNARTWKWQCFVCEESGGEIALKKAHGNFYEVDGDDTDDLQRQRDEAFALAIKAKTKRTDVERWAESLQKDPAAEGARRYLVDERHISLETAKELLLGWSPVHPDAKQAKAPSRRRRRAGAPEPEAPADPKSAGWITIPSFTRHGADGAPVPSSCACVKLRSVPPAPKAYRRITGGESILYSPTGIDPTETLVIVGGELDAVVLSQLGCRNVVAGTTGEKGWSDVWTRQLEDVEDIVIIYDGDATGREGAEKLSAMLGHHRVRIGSWPEGYNDANDAFVGMGPGEFDVFYVQGQIIARAQSIVGKGVSRINGRMRERYKARHQKDGHRGISSGWAHYDDAFGGVRFPELTIVTGDTGSGKTTWLSDWLRRMASPVPCTDAGSDHPFERGRPAVPSLVVPLEMGVDLQLDKFVRQQSTYPPEDLSEEQLDATLDQLGDMPLWVMRPPREDELFNLEALRNTLVWCARKKGIRFVVIDHLQFMVEEGHAEERAQITKVLKMLVSVAKAESLHIVLVAHPHGTGKGSDKDRDNRVIQLGDLKGSTAIKQLTWNALSVWRKRDATREGVLDSQGYGETIVYALKVRSDYGYEGSIPFQFWIRSATYSDPSSGLPLKFATQKGGPAQHRKHWTEDD